jgi:uncharacterized protein (UPF0332 family)
LTEDNCRSNVKMEVESGREVREEARVLLDRGLVKGAISRTYYYAFHMTRALLFSLGLEPKTHEGANHLLNLHFLRSGKLPPEFGKLLGRLQKYREQADYDAVQVFAPGDAEEELGAADAFADAALDYLRREGFFEE